MSNAHCWAHWQCHGKSNTSKKQQTRNVPQFKVGGMCCQCERGVSDVISMEGTKKI